MRKPQQPPNAIERFSERIHELGKLMTDPDYRDFVNRAESRYWHWDKLRFIARAKNLDPELLWIMIKIGRGSQLRQLPLYGHNSVNLSFMLPSSAQQELMFIDRELAGRVMTHNEGRLPISKGQRERFVISALQEEAIASSMLEGAVTTRQEAKQMLRSGRQPRTHGERMVANNYRTILFIRENRNVDLSAEYLLEVQKLLTDGTIAPDHVGRFRTDADNVDIIDMRDNEVMHVPPPAQELEYRLNQLFKFANNRNDNPFIHPVVKACVLHFQIGYDHPFCDGNGRTARAIFYWYLLRMGYWLFEYLPISPLFLKSPGKYSRAYLYTETDNFDLTYFLMYNLKVIEQGRIELRRYLTRKQSQFSQAHRLFKSDPTLNHRQQELLLKVTRNPDMIMTMNDHQHTYGIAYGTARTDLFDLAEKLYLTAEKLRKKYVFTQGPKLKKLDPSETAESPQLLFPRTD